MSISSVSAAAPPQFLKHQKWQVFKEWGRFQWQVVCHCSDIPGPPDSVRAHTPVPSHSLCLHSHVLFMALGDWLTDSLTYTHSPYTSSSSWVLQSSLRPNTPHYGRLVYESSASRQRSSLSQMSLCAPFFHCYLVCHMDVLKSIAHLFLSSSFTSPSQLSDTHTCMWITKLNLSVCAWLHVWNMWQFPVCMNAWWVWDWKNAGVWMLFPDGL